MTKRKFKFVAETSWGHHTEEEIIEYSADELKGMTEEEVQSMVEEDWQDWFNDHCNGTFMEVEE